VAEKHYLQIMDEHWERAVILSPTGPSSMSNQHPFAKRKNKKTQPKAGF
jgi:hypothetical protein